MPTRSACAGSSARRRAHLGRRPPHHRTASMLERYDTIDVDDLQRPTECASAYQGEPAMVHALRSVEKGE